VKSGSSASTLRQAASKKAAARGGRKLESIPDAIMSEVLARISPIFE
jgi:hypothetical protein